MNHEETEAIRFEQVSKSFDSTPLLENVSFEVARGEAFCILGRSGTGKTVLLKLMVGMLKPNRGKIFINQEEITVLDMPSLLRLRKRVGFLFQNGALFDSISVADNLAFPLRYHSGETVQGCADRASIALNRFAQSWEAHYPMSAAAWRNHWDNLTRFFRCPVDLRSKISRIAGPNARPGI